MKLTGEEARDIVYEDDGDWKAVSIISIIDTSRWSVIQSQVFKFVLTGQFYEFIWSEGATECQDERAYENETFYEPIEVEEKEVTIKQWVKKE